MDSQGVKGNASSENCWLTQSKPETFRIEKRTIALIMASLLDNLKYLYVYIHIDNVHIYIYVYMYICMYMYIYFCLYNLN